MKWDFLCVGYQKAGTTTLYDILRQHPDVVLSEIKEICYFRKKRKSRADFRRVMKKYYNVRHEKQIVGAIEPSYIVTATPQEICSYYGRDLKIIIMVREPLARLYSYYRMDMRNGYVPLPGKKEGKGVGESFCEYMYAHRNDEKVKKAINMREIQMYQKVFGEENVKVVVFEKFFSDVAKGAKDIFEFLDLRDCGIDLACIHSNEGNYISRDKVCSIINNLLIRGKQFCIDCGMGLQWIEKYMHFADMVYKYTLVENKEKVNWEKSRLHKFQRDYENRFLRER